MIPFATKSLRVALLKVMEYVAPLLLPGNEGQQSFSTVSILALFSRSLKSPILVFRLVKTMYSRQNLGFAESSLKELAPLPCIARLRVRKETN